MLGEAIRRIGFWGLDAIKGGKIKNRAAVLEEIKKKPQVNQTALEDILRHAISTVPAYSSIPEPSINLFPVVSKNEYRKDFDTYRSKQFQNDEELLKVFTSGSTGNPFMAFQDQDKISWHQAGLMSLNKSIGWNLGDKFMFMRVWGVAHNEGKLGQIKSNMIPVDVMDFTDSKKEAVCRVMAKQKNLHLILGYASALTSLAEYILQKKYSSDDFNIRLIIADSENLSSTAKATIEKAFGCMVLNRYGNNENGILGITLPNDDRMWINYPEYYVEILKTNSNEPVEVGECGRIVITDFYNKAFPFIRYDTGDLGVADEIVDGQCIRLKELVGRVAGTLRKTKGTLIGEAVVTSFFENLTALGRYQIIQRSDFNYIVRVENTSEDLDGELVCRAKRCFGDDARITVEHVKQIEQGKNGKYKVTVFEG